MSTVESSAFFLRDHDTGNEIIIFGDVEPDSVSLEPRNRRVWQNAAPKVANGTLSAIFIECSYTDAIDDAYLYGHLCPRHLIAELSVLADKVLDIRERGTASDKKRKRLSVESPLVDRSPRSKRAQSTSSGKVRTSSRTPFATSEPVEGMSELSSFDDLVPPDPTRWAKGDPPLVGLSVYIIHIKETLKDGSTPGEKIVEELNAHGEEYNLGCQFFLPDPSEAIDI